MLDFKNTMKNISAYLKSRSFLVNILLIIAVFIALFFLMLLLVKDYLSLHQLDNMPDQAPKGLPLRPRPLP